jgi:hypothetical protein
VAGLQESAVQGLLSLHTTAGPGLHCPAAHVSPAVHALPSEQVPEAGLDWQPDAGLQESTVHALLSLHTTAAPGAQAPAAHTSAAVQAFPSVHGAEFGVKVQPLAGLHASSVQGLLSLHTTATPALHAPPAH